MSSSPPLPYCCPGETQPISQAVHLGRLASFYPACRACPHAHQTHTLAPRVARQLESTRRRAMPSTLFHEEGIAGAFLNELGPAEVRRAATALAMVLSDNAASHRGTEIALACDGRSIAAELAAAASDALRQAGWNVVDLGFCTAGALVDSIARVSARGGIYIGRGDAGPQQIALTFFGESGVPFSAGGTLDRLSRLWHDGFDRPSRKSGTVRRRRVDAAVMTRLDPHLHALRPMKLVLDTASMPLRRQLAGLAQRVSLEIIDAGAGEARAANPRAALAPLPHVSERIVAASAHFGLWVDGDGVRCRLFDEQGNEVRAERLAPVWLRYFHERFPDAPLVVESAALPTVRSHLRRDAVVHVAPAAQEFFAQTMLATGAIAGADRQGRFWLAHGVPTACAQTTLAVLLAILSRSDQPASVVFA